MRSDVVHVHVPLYGVLQELSLPVKVHYKNSWIPTNETVKMRLSEFLWAYLGCIGLNGTAWAFAHNGYSPAEAEAWSWRSYFYVGGEYKETTLVCSSAISTHSSESTDSFSGRRTTARQHI